VLLAIVFQLAVSAPVTRTIQWGLNDDPSTFSITINVGDSITWQWSDSNTHNVVSGSNSNSDGLFSSGTVVAGSSFTRLFDTAGSFPYFCEHHPDIMFGTITVVVATTVPTSTITTIATTVVTTMPTAVTTIPTTRVSTGPTTIPVTPTLLSTTVPTTEASTITTPILLTTTVVSGTTVAPSSCNVYIPWGRGDIMLEILTPTNSDFTWIFNRDLDLHQIVVINLDTNDVFFASKILAAKQSFSEKFSQAGRYIVLDAWNKALHLRVRVEDNASCPFPVYATKSTM